MQDEDILVTLVELIKTLTALQLSPEATVESNLALMHVQQAHEQMLRRAHNRAKQAET